MPTLLLVAPAMAQTAGMVGFQGLIKDAGGVPVSGAVTLQFRIFDAQTVGNLVDMDGDGVVEPLVGQDVKEVVVTATNGVVSTKFGPVHPKAFEGTLPFERWLQVSVNGTPLSRIEMAAAPATAEQVNIPSTATPAITVDATGNVGIGMTTPQSTLQVGNDVMIAEHLYMGTFAPANPPRRLEIFAQSPGENFRTHLLVHSGVGQDAASPTVWFDSASQSADTAVLRVTGDSNADSGGPFHFEVMETGLVKARILQITGGADLAEPFAVNSPDEKLGMIEPGMVVVIDPENPGKLKLSTEPYDGKVAGIISGANGLSPGMVMKAVGANLVDPALALGARIKTTGADNPIRAGSASDRSCTGGDASAAVEHPVALTGRVWCWCDATYGPIQPGDRLTTSATPGHAMKVTDSARAPGAVIGKAMTPLSKGRGLVLVLVQPQ